MTTKKLQYDRVFKSHCIMSFDEIVPDFRYIKLSLLLLHYFTEIHLNSLYSENNELTSSNRSLLAGPVFCPISDHVMML